MIVQRLESLILTKIRPSLVNVSLIVLFFFSILGLKNNSFLVLVTQLFTNEVLKRFGIIIVVSSQFLHRISGQNTSLGPVAHKLYNYIWWSVWVFCLLCLFV